jgi:hypothetical protein
LVSAMFLWSPPGACGSVHEPVHAADHPQLRRDL